MPMPQLLLLTLLALLVFLLDEARASSQTAKPSMETGLHLVWEGINFQVSRWSSGSSFPGSRIRRQESILKNVSGEALPGRLLAIMGPSGSGKSSLLNVLAGRVPAAKNVHIDGKVQVGDVPLQEFDTQRYIAYVRQQQDFYPFLTVRETLLIAAGLRLDRHVSPEQRFLESTFRGDAFPIVRRAAISLTGPIDSWPPLTPFRAGNTHARCGKLYRQESMVQDIIDKLGLSRAADTLVGDIRTPGISGGEKRRLAMGLQLIDLETPSIIFIDEPTSGLDSHQALQVMEAVRGLCEEGHSVVVAIHQPRSSIYALFDDILLLSEGAVMYHGATKAALPWLASLGHKCPSNFNPADFMVDLISPDTNNGYSGSHRAQGVGDSVDSTARALEKMAKATRKDWEANSAVRHARQSYPQDTNRRRRHWGEGTENRFVRTDRDHRESLTFGGGALATGRISDSLELQLGGGRHHHVKTRSGWLTQFRLLLKRSWKQATRDKFAAAARVALGFGLGGVFGSIFWKLGLQESSIQNRVSLFVNVAMNTSMFGCIRALQTLAIERKVVALERMDQGYSASAYLSSKILSELPIDAVFPLIFGTTVYFAAGLNDPVGGFVKLAKFLGIVLVQAHASSALGLMVGCLSPSMEVANLAGPALIVVSLMLSGVHDNIPSYLQKLEAVSAMKWGVQGIVTNEMRGIKFVPDGKQLLLGWKLGTDKEVIAGEAIMEKMGFKGEGLVKPTRRLLQLTAGFHFITLLNLIVGTPRFQRLEESAASTRPSFLDGDGQDQT